MIQTADITKAASCLLSGGVIAYPTETLPGLGCLATDDEAVHEILKIKQRPENKGLILLVSSIEQLRPWVVKLNEAMLSQLNSDSESPTTWLIPTADKKQPLLQGSHNKLAIRITTHPTAVQLCNQVNQAIVSTSINLTNTAPATELSGIPPAIIDQLDLLLTGPDGTGQPSKIIDLLTHREYR